MYVLGHDGSGTHYGCLRYHTRCGAHRVSIQVSASASAVDGLESDTSLVPTFCGRDPTAPSRPATQGRKPAPLSIATDANRQELASESL